MNKEAYFKEFLSNELERRCEKNPSYSTRAFAKALDIDVASLSRILNGKQIPSYSICQTLFDKLAVPPTEQKRFLQSVAVEQKIKNVKRVSPKFRIIAEEQNPPKELSVDVWHAIADWYHGAIMELTFTKDFKSDFKWIAKTLGLSETQVKLAVQRLIRLGLLEEKDGAFKKVHRMVATKDKSITSPAHKKLQRQVLEKAILSLENDPLESRNMSSITMAIDPRKVGEAKGLIQKFSRDLCAFLETGEQTQVYQLSVNLFPISKLGGS